MFEEIVVGVDQSGGGLDAIALARNLVVPGGRLNLVHVVVSGPYIGVGHPAGNAADEQSHSLEEFERTRALTILKTARGQARLQQTGLEVELRCVLSSSAGRGLHESAEAQDANLIAVGSSRRGLLGRVLMGDDTRAALNGAPASVAIAPAGYSEQPAHFHTIGIGYDGSTESERALDVGRALVDQHGAKLSAFTAVSVPTFAFGPGPLPLRDPIDALIGNAHERIAALGDVEPHVAYGAAAEELMAFSGSVDLLIVGSRGYGPIGRLIHGSTSRRLARTARCPLLVLARAGHVRDHNNEHHPARSAGARR